jgi:hypothetical protein
MGRASEKDGWVSLNRKEEGPACVRWQAECGGKSIRQISRDRFSDRQLFGSVLVCDIDMCFTMLPHRVKLRRLPERG